jgi:hypothetical protein
MNEKTAKVFNGWAALTTDERQEFDRAVRDYNQQNESGKTKLRESVRKTADARMETGPLGRGCPCCGR